jgi:glycosyltransferase involved in cell wall biosynthesis
MAYEVTIGIPVYNVEKYIRLTMDSALAQTFDSIEFLVLDDCGTDSSIDIVREYQQTHARGKDIRIVRQPQNGGIGRARNRIVEEAQGRYLYFLDADDLMISTTISLMMSAVLKYNAEIVMASYQQVELYNDKPQNKLFHFSHLFFSKPDELATYAFSHYGALQANIWNVLLDLNIVRKYHLQFVNTNFWEDMVFKYDLVTYIFDIFCIKFNFDIELCIIVYEFFFIFFLFKLYPELSFDILYEVGYILLLFKILFECILLNFGLSLFLFILL